MSIDKIIEETFGERSHRDPRSDEYQEGCEAALQNAVEHTEIKCPWRMGNVKADAWLAGYEEGRNIIKGLKVEPIEAKDEGKFLPPGALSESKFAKRWYANIERNKAKGGQNL